MKGLTLNKSINLNSPVSKVWEALTKRELIKVYFFGTDCLSDWKKGSPIIYRGVWEDKAYEDKGNIIDIEHEKFIFFNYWSSMSGTQDIPENYAEIRFELSAGHNQTTFTVIQHGIKTQEEHDHSATNWGYIMDGLKKMLEA